MVSVWSDPDFVVRSTLEYHRHLTHVMLACFDLLERSFVSSKKLAACIESLGWVGELMRGVQVRFDSVDIAVRTFGMLVAERLSDILSPSSPLRFDEIRHGERAHSIDVMYFDRETALTDITGGPISLAPTNEGVVGRAVGQIGLAVQQINDTDIVWDDPDAVLSRVDDASDSASDTDGQHLTSSNSSDSVESLVPYLCASNPHEGAAATRRPPVLRMRLQFHPFHFYLHFYRIITLDRDVVISECD